jgi:trimeric autotransporter adhesin
MNVSNSLLGSLTSSLLTSASSTAATTSTSSPSSPAIGGAGSTSISSAGQFFSEMQQLSQANPTEFKAVAAQVATSFQDAASKASGPQAQMLTSLANQFSQAAQTGTLPSPQSQGSGTKGAHHHHRHGGGGSTSQSSSVQSAFQSAMQILQQATESGSASGSSTST